MMENNQESDLQPQFSQLNIRSENLNGSNPETLENLRSKLEKLEKENCDLKTKILANETQAKESEQKIANLTQECEWLKTDNENLKKVNSCLHTSCTSLTDATIALSEKVQRFKFKKFRAIFTRSIL